MAMLIFEEDSVFNPADYGLKAGDMIDVICVGGGGGGSGCSPSSQIEYVGVGGNGSSSSFGSYCTAEGGEGGGNSHIKLSDLMGNHYRGYGGKGMFYGGGFYLENYTYSNNNNSVYEKFSPGGGAGGFIVGYDLYGGTGGGFDKDVTAESSAGAANVEGRTKSRYGGNSYQYPPYYVGAGSSPGAGGGGGYGAGGAGGGGSKNVEGLNDTDTLDYLRCGNGGGSGYVVHKSIRLQDVDPIPVTVGAGGGGGAGTSNGSNGAIGGNGGNGKENGNAGGYYYYSKTSSYYIGGGGGAGGGGYSGGKGGQEGHTTSYGTFNGGDSMTGPGRGGDSYGKDGHEGRGYGGGSGGSCYNSEVVYEEGNGGAGGAGGCVIVFF